MCFTSSSYVTAVSHHGSDQGTPQFGHSTITHAGKNVCTSCIILKGARNPPYKPGYSRILQRLSNCLFLS